MVNQDFDVMPIINAATQAKDYLTYLADPDLLPSNIHPTTEHSCQEFKEIISKLAKLHATKKRALERDASPPTKRIPIESPDQTNRPETPWQEELISELTEGWGVERPRFEGEEEETEPSHNLGGFRQHLEKITNHWYRKQKDGSTKTTFLCHWKDFPLCKSEETIELAIKGRKAMREYLLGKSTRARNTLLNRNPELAGLLKQIQ